MTQLPSETRYTYAQIPGCETKVSVNGTGDEVLPACLGGVSMVGCARPSDCREIKWCSGGSERISALLEALHAEDVGHASEPVAAHSSNLPGQKGAN